MIGSFNQGGSERQAVALTRLLKNEGSFDVFAATLSNEGVLKSDMESLGLPPIAEFPLTSFFNANFLRQTRLCAGYLKENNISVIHTHDFYTNVFGMAAASLAGVNARIASKRETGGMRSPNQDKVEKLAFRRAKAIVVNSDSVRTYLIGRGIAESKLRLIYNGLAISRFTPSSDSSKFLTEAGISANPSTRFVTLVANLRHDVKNVPMLLRAAKKVLAQYPHTHFIVAGEGRLDTELKDLAEHLGVSENVNFIGRCTDVPALLEASYACVLTSTAEGFSNSILEYMAAGNPVVATNVGGAGEAIIDGSTGYLVASDDDGALASRLIELLREPEKARRFGDEGRAVVAAKFSESAQLASTLDLYNSILR